MCIQWQSAVFPSTAAEWTETVIVFILMQVLNEYFHNVCELDLVFNFYKVRLFFQDIQNFNLVWSWQDETNAAEALLWSVAWFSNQNNSYISLTHTHTQLLAVWLRRHSLMDVAQRNVW